MKVKNFLNSILRPTLQNPVSEGMSNYGRDFLGTSTCLFMVVWGCLFFFHFYALSFAILNAKVLKVNILLTSIQECIQRAGLKRIWSKRCLSRAPPVGRFTRKSVSLRNTSNTAGVTWSFDD